MSTSATDRARHFMENETAFHLGALPTEQSNPKTADLSRVIGEDAVAGIRMLQSVDRDVAVMAARVLFSAPFEKLVKTMTRSLSTGGRIIFSGCGATGRLSIQLEACWREYCRSSEAPPAIGKLEDRVLSIMTGGDYALVRSVESFEDYMVFGRQQVREMNLGELDALVAVTEGGETSSVIGTCWEALERGAAVFLLFNNPTETLRDHVERSREIIDHPRVTVLDLYCGPMAIAGSTRMQATTSELLVAGAALECALADLKGEKRADYGARFNQLLGDLEAAAPVMAEYAAFEASVYRDGGLVTYFADDFMIDIFTDTTERSPTFMIPPFKRFDDHEAQCPWAFAKNPTLPTPEAWRKTLQRRPRCLNWTSAQYAEMGAAPTLISAPPALAEHDLEMFVIGSENDPSRYSASPNAAVAVLCGDESQKLNSGMPFGEGFLKLSQPFDERKVFMLGTKGEADFIVSIEPPTSPLRLWQHLALKLALNTLSTATMALLGRVEGNWMAYVQASNKKLIDRSVRLVAELTGVDAMAACCAVFEAMEEIGASTDRCRSPVQVALQKLTLTAHH